jgi:hypothetical protein
VIVVAASCGPATPAPAGRQRAASCDPGHLEVCERKLLAAVAAVDVRRELVVSYLAARRAAADDDVWAGLWRKMGDPDPAPLVVIEKGWADGQAARPGPPMRIVDVDPLPPPKAIHTEELLVALAEAASVKHVVYLRRGRGVGAVHLVPGDPLAPFVPTLRPALRDSAAHLVEDAALASVVRSAFEHAAASRYREAARDADELVRRTSRADGNPSAAAARRSAVRPLRPSEVRARFALEVLSSAGVLLEPVSGQRLDESVDHPAPTADGTAYEDWMRVRTARDERAEWARRRERILGGVPADRRADVDALDPRPGDCSGAARPPPEIRSVHDLVFAARVAGSLAPRIGDEASAAPGQLTLAQWLPRYQALVRTVERTQTAWAHLPSLLSQRAELMGQHPDAISLYRRVTELARAHATALRALERAEPVRYRAMSHLPLVFSPGVLGDERLRASVVELTQATVQDKLSHAQDATAVFDGLLAGFFAGMSYPPAIQAEQFVALQGAFTAKLRGDLTRERGWPVAGLYALDAAVRLLGDREQASRTLSFSADQIARALAGADMPHPAAAALATSLARYSALAIDGKLDARRDNPAHFAPERRAARAALEAAVRTLAGPDDRPPNALVADVTTLADGLVAAVATHFADRAKAAAGGAAVCARDAGLGPVVARAVARLGDVRRRILLHPRFERDRGAWGKRSRMLVTVLSDALDLLAFRGPRRAATAAGRPDKRALTVEPAAAESRMRDGLSDWDERAGAAAVAQAYLLLRDLLVAESGEQFVVKSGGRIRAVLEGVRLFFGDGQGGARIALLDVLAGLPDRGPPRAGEELLVGYARSLFERGQRDQGDLLLVAALGAAALTRTAPSRDSVELASSSSSRVAWALRFLAELAAGRRGAAPDPSAYAAAMRAVRDDACHVADSEDMLGAMSAVRGFASGGRAEARAALDALLDKAERRGLSVPKITYRYEEKTESKVLALSLDVSYGAGFLEGSNSLQLGLGIRSRGEPEGKMITAFAPAAAPEAGEEAARTYVHLAALAAAYHYLDRDLPRAAAAAGRAVAALTAGVRLGARAVVSPAAAGWAADSRALLAVDAQLAAEAGQPFLAGDLWTVLRASLDPDSDDAAIAAVLDEVPVGLAAVADAKPVLERARRTLRVVAAPLPCTDAKVEVAGFQETGCDGYPLALSLRIADALKRLPRLRRAGADAARCADLRALDAFLEGADRRTYDPDAFTRAVQALTSEGKDYEAAVLLARQRAGAHCNPTLGAAARTLGAGSALPASLRADLLSVAINCSASNLDDRVIADVIALDATTRALADPTRNFKVLLFSTDLALRARRWDLLVKMAAQPDFVSRWLDGSPAAGTAALLVDHAAAVLSGAKVDVERTKNAFQVFCQTFASADRAELCADVEALRKGGADARARAEQGLGRLVTAATSLPKGKASP